MFIVCVLEFVISKSVLVVQAVQCLKAHLTYVSDVWEINSLQVNTNLHQVSCDIFTTVTGCGPNPLSSCQEFVLFLALIVCQSMKIMSIICLILDRQASAIPSSPSNPQMEKKRF